MYSSNPDYCLSKHLLYCTAVCVIGNDTKSVKEKRTTLKRRDVMETAPRRHRSAVICVYIRGLNKVCTVSSSLACRLTLLHGVRKSTNSRPVINELSQNLNKVRERDT
jgi:hypothetical protein